MSTNSITFTIIFQPIYYKKEPMFSQFPFVFLLLFGVIFLGFCIFLWKYLIPNVKNLIL